MTKAKNRHIFNTGMQMIYMVGKGHQSFQLITSRGSEILLNLMKIS